MSDDEKGLWAPRTNTGQFRSTDGNSVSFEAYFLRGLFAEGKIDEQLIRDLIAAEKLNCDPDEILAAISDPLGQSIPRGLTAVIQDIAQVIVEQN